MVVVNIIKMRYFFLLLILFFSFEKNSWGENIVSDTGYERLGKLKLDLVIG